jgi:hypothetical protein
MLERIREGVAVPLRFTSLYRCRNARGCRSVRRHWRVRVSSRVEWSHWRVDVYSIITCRVTEGVLSYGSVLHGGIVQRRQGHCRIAEWIRKRHSTGTVSRLSWLTFARQGANGTITNGMANGFLRQSSAQSTISDL